MRCSVCSVVFGVALPASSTLGAEMCKALPDSGRNPIVLENLPAPPAPWRVVLLEEQWGEEPCPRCGQQVPSNCPRCPGCGLLLVQEDARPWEQPGAPPRRDCEPHRGPFWATLGMLGLVLTFPAPCGVICCPLLVIALMGLPLCIVTRVLAQRDLDLMRRKQMDPAGHLDTERGAQRALVGIYLGSICLVLGFVLHLAIWLG
ncbi:MAG: hypothetical protein ACK4RK_12210 [Gemmataceae bacterium]